MFEVREYQKKQGWILVQEVGLQDHQFDSVEEAQAEIEVFMFHLMASYLDGYIKKFDENEERKGLGIFDTTTGALCQLGNGQRC